MIGITPPPPPPPAQQSTHVIFTLPPLRFIYTERKQKRFLFFDLGRWSKWTLNLILYELFWKRCRCRFRFRTNINEPLFSVIAWRCRSFWSLLLHHVTPWIRHDLVTCLCLLGNRGLCFSCGWRLIHFLPGDLVMARLHVPSPSPSPSQLP